jgi:DNA-directed RNA polymerase subunit RPC12/RpoP
LTSETGNSEGHSDSIRTLILTIHEDMGNHFVTTLCPDDSGRAGEALIEGQRFELHVLADDPRSLSTWTEEVSEADALVLQVRFMDALSVDRLQTICNHLPRNKVVPFGIFLMRESGEIDFKISCSTCGQKLWVRDTDEGKKGRCPNCKRAFKLKSQAEHAKSELGLSPDVAVVTVIRDDASSCSHAIQCVTLNSPKITSDDSADSDPDVLLKPTVRVDVNGDKDSSSRPPS